MNIRQHYAQALQQYNESEATEPPTTLIATPDVVHAFDREIGLEGVHVIYTKNDRPVLRIK